MSGGVEFTKNHTNHKYKNMIKNSSGPAVSSSLMARKVEKPVRIYPVTYDEPEEILSAASGIIIPVSKTLGEFLLFVIYSYVRKFASVMRANIHARIPIGDYNCERWFFYGYLSRLATLQYILVHSKYVF